MKDQRIESLLEYALKARIGSGIAASYGKIDDLKNGCSPHEFYLGTHSHLVGSEKVNRNSVFDLASLTKILLTTLLAMIEVEHERIDLDDSLEERLPEYVKKNPGARTITVRHLLTHGSGLPAWRPFYESLRARFGESLRTLHPAVRKAYFDACLDEVPIERGVGEKLVYSDLGFLLLERVLSDDVLESSKNLFNKIPGLQLKGIRVPSVKGEGREFVATEICPWRGLLQGEVHDDNAWSRGGVSGHAGLFGRLIDIQLWVESLFKERWVSLKTLKKFSETVSDSGGSVRAHGFDVPSREGLGSTGAFFSMNSIGHLGFTGTSLWMDLDSGDYAILLTNRVHPLRTDERIRKLRLAFHEEVRR